MCLQTPPPYICIVFWLTAKQILIESITIVWYRQGISYLGPYKNILFHRLELLCQYDWLFFLTIAYNNKTTK